MNSSSGDLWYVKLADGDVHRVTLDQLDEAFQAGHIDADTMVLAAGGSAWSKLGDLAGIDDDAVPVEAGPVEHAVGYVPQIAPPPAARVTPGYAARAPSPYATTSPQFSYGTPYGAPSYGAPSYAPASSQAAARAPAPYGAPSYAPAPVRAPVPNSLRPVSVDFGDDLDVGELRRGGGKKWVVALLAVAALGAGGFVVVKQRPAWAQPTLNRLGLRGVTAQVTAAAVAPPPAPVEAPPPAVAPPPAPPPQAPVAAPSPAPVPGNDSPLNPHFTNSSDRLTDDQKQHLLDADKKGHAHKGHAASAVHVSTGASKTKSTTFTTGGSKYDPLNSSI
jgi:hypothetical protein